MSRKSLD